MRRSVPWAAAALLLTGCVIYEGHAYAPPPGSRAALPATVVIEAREAEDIAFRLCQDRALRVDRVKRARLDSAGRWHLTLAGMTDRAQLVLDGRDGKLLRGRFYREDSAPPGASPSQTPPAPAPGSPPSEPPPGPPADLE